MVLLVLVQLGVVSTVTCAEISWVSIVSACCNISPELEQLCYKKGNKCIF